MSTFGDWLEAEARNATDPKVKRWFERHAKKWKKAFAGKQPAKAPRLPAARPARRARKRRGRASSA